MQFLSDNRRALYDYLLLDELEVGIVLSGPEVRSVRAGGLRLRGSYATIHNGSLSLIGAHIAPYTPAAHHNPVDRQRSRRLLAHKREIAKIIGKMESERLTLIPKNAYSRGGHIKITLALARHKQLHEKREVLKKRTIARDVRRALDR